LQENRAKKERVSDFERREKVRQERLQGKKFGEGELVVRYSSKIDGTGLHIPKYCDYVSLLIPQFNYPLRHEKHDGGHSQKHACAHCGKAGKYKVPKRNVSVCSSQCYRAVTAIKH